MNFDGVSNPKMRQVLAGLWICFGSAAPVLADLNKGNWWGDHPDNFSFFLFLLAGILGVYTGVCIVGWSIFHLGANLVFGSSDVEGPQPSRPTAFLAAYFLAPVAASFVLIPPMGFLASTPSFLSVEVFYSLFTLGFLIVYDAIYRVVRAA